MLSVSLGSSLRDFAVETTVGGVRFRLMRRGTDGNIKKACEIVGQADGQVDAIGLGGVNLAYHTGRHSFECASGIRIRRASKKTLVVDGWGFKSSYEARVPQFVSDHVTSVARKRVLMVSVLDRWPLAKAFQDQGARIVVGDALFALGLPVPFVGLRFFETVCMLSMPLLSRVPIGRLYPLGARQHKSVPRFGRLFRLADVVAGDFHMIRRYLPRSLHGAWVVTTTTTADDRCLLRERGAAGVVTMTQPIEGRTVGANMLEAMACACAGQAVLNRSELLDYWEQFGLKPCIMRFG